jgi:hypothetical protein
MTERLSYPHTEDCGVKWGAGFPYAHGGTGRLSAEDKIGYLFDKYEVFLSADMFDEIHKIIKQAEQAAYDRGLKEAKETAFKEFKGEKGTVAIFNIGYANGFKEAIEKAAILAENIPMAMGRSPSPEGLRLSIADGIRQLKS